MKVNKLVNVSPISKMSVYAIIILAMVFIFAFFLIYYARYDMVYQSMRLNSRIDAHQALEEIKDIVNEHAETISNCNIMLTNYLSTKQDKQKVFNYVLGNMLYNLKTVDALCIMLDNEKDDTGEERLIVYAERLENDSIAINNYIDVYQEPRLMPHNAPALIDLVGPFYWKVKDDDDKKQFLVLWQRIYDSKGAAIGTVYLDILCSNYFNYITNIANNYNAKIYISKKDSDKYIYAEDNFDMIGTNIEKTHWFGSHIYSSFNQGSDLSFDAIITNKSENFIYFMNFLIPNTNISLNVGINFDTEMVKNENSKFKHILLIILIITYILFSFIIIKFSHYVESKYSDADVIVIENEEED